METKGRTTSGMDSGDDGKDVHEKDIPLDASNLQHVDFDGVYRFLGPRGKYQMTQYFLHNVFFFPVFITFVHGIFVGKFIDFTCAETGTSFNASALPTNQTLDFSECQVEVKDNVTSNVLHRETCTQYDYEGGNTYVSYIAEWDLVCDNDVIGQLPQVLLYAGQCLGALLIPPLGDRYGRRVVTRVTILGEFLTMFFAVFAQQFWLFLLLRFFVGVFNQSVSVPVGSMIMEVVPAELRAWTSLVTSMCWILAMVLVGVIGFLLQDADWRMLQLAYALVGGIPSIIALFFLDESLMWLVANSRFKRVEETLRKACRWNRKDIDTLKNKIVSDSLKGQESPKVKLLQNGDHHSSKETTADLDGGYKFMDMIKDKNIRTITLVSVYMWMITSFTYYAILLMSTSLAGDPYVNYFLAGIVDFLAGIMVYYVLTGVDRRPTMIGFNLASAVALLLTVLVAYVAPSNKAFGILQTCLTMTGQFFVSSTFYAVWVYTPELYPTNLRNLGLGISSAAARAGASFSPLFTIVARRMPWVPGALFGTCCLLCALLLTMLPETRGVPLPETVQDVDNMFKRTRNRKRYVVTSDDKNQHLNENA